MFDPLKPSDYGNYDNWAQTFAEASARLDALETAVTDLRHLLRYGKDVHSAEILEVLERHDVWPFERGAAGQNLTGSRYDGH